MKMASFLCFSSEQVKCHNIKNLDRFPIFSHDSHVTTHIKVKILVLGSHDYMKIKFDCWHNLPISPPLSNPVIRKPSTKTTTVFAGMPGNIILGVLLA